MRIAGRPWPAAAVAAVSWGVAGAVVLQWGRTWFLDLRVYRGAGHLLFSGGDAYRSVFTEHSLPFTYPPFALLALSPSAFGPLRLVEALWWVANAAAIVAVIAIALTEGTSLRGTGALWTAAAIGGVAVLVLEPLRSDMDYGQVNALLMLLVVVDLFRLRGRGRGVLVGLAAAVKLTPLVYLAFFALRREWAACARGLAVFAGAAGLAWVLLPSESAQYWLHLAFDPARTGNLGGVSNQSWRGLLARLLPHGQAGAEGLWLLAVAVTAVVAVLLAGRLLRTGRPVEALLALALCELLVSPVSWTHHWSWLVLAPPVAMTLWSRHRVAAGVLAATVLAAVVAPYWWVHRGWLEVPAANALVVGGACALLVWAVAELRAPAEPAPRATGLLQGGAAGRVAPARSPVHTGEP